MNNTPVVEQHFWIVWIILGMILTGGAGILGAYIAFVSKVESIVDRAMKELRDHLVKEMTQVEHRLDRLEGLMFQRASLEHPRPTDEA